MSRVRVLVGTRKGAFILTADGRRRSLGRERTPVRRWELYHLKGSPADPNRMYASQSTGWFGQVIQRSDDGGKTWEAVGNEFVYDGVPGTHQWYDGTPHPWEFARVWHLEPSLNDPDTVYAGVEDAAFFRSVDGGQSWAGAVRAAGSQHRPELAAGRGRHVPAHDPARPDATPAACSSPSPRRACSAATTPARPGGRSTRSPLRGIPDPTPRSATACTASPCTRRGPTSLFMQKHWDVMRSDDGGESWHEVSGDLPTDFGFPIDVHAHEPETVYVVPDQERLGALSRPRASCASTAAGWVATSGSPSRPACRRRTAT